MNAFSLSTKRSIVLKRRKIAKQKLKLCNQLSQIELNFRGNYCQILSFFDKINV
jgi:hypothetical protein